MANLHLNHLNIHRKKENLIKVCCF